MSQKLKRRKQNQRNRLTSYDALEPRQLLATLTVTTTSDVADGSIDGEVSFREAIIATNTNAAFGDAPAGDVLNDRIEFADSLFGQTITLAGSELPITGQLTIRAEGDGVTIDGNFESRVFAIDTDQDVILRNLTITRGIEGDEAGGGIFTTGGGTLRLFESNFIDNGKPDGEEDPLGGGIFNSGSTLVSTGSTFVGNQGGAIHSASQLDVRIFNSTFVNNRSSNGGAAIRVDSGDLFVSNSTFENNADRFRFDPSGNGGGAILIVDHDNAEEGTFAYVIDSTFEDNSSGDGGGAISNGENNVFIVRNSTFTSNSSFRQGSRNAPAAGNGGAIESMGSLRLVDVSFTENRSGSGGAVFSSGNTIFNRVQFQRNSANYTGGAAVLLGNAGVYETSFGGDEGDGNSASSTFNAIRGQGGGLAIFGSSREGSAPNNVRVIGGSFKNNTAGLEGGAIYIDKNSSVNVLAGTRIESNAAIGSGERILEEVVQGGAVSNYGTTLIASAEIVNNSATDFGGGVHNGEGNLTMINSVISANQADRRGGGFEIAGGNVRLFSSIIGGDLLADGNVAGVFGESTGAGNGGGVFVSGGEGTRFQMNRGNISFNTATKSGGGLLSLAGSVVRFDSGVQVTNNRALSEDGGGLFNHGSHFEIRDAVFEGNEARSGGGIFNNVGSVHLTNTTLNDNTARVRAGGFYNRGTYRFASSNIVDNLAPEFTNFFDETT